MNVVRKLPVGVVGEIADSSLQRVLMKTVGTGASVEIGSVVTETNGVIAQGGTGAYAGIAISPKQLAKTGLTNSMTVPAGGSCEVMSFGRVWVKVASAVTAGAPAFYASNGTISAATGGGNTAIPRSKFLTGATGAPGDVVALLELS